MSSATAAKSNRTTAPRKTFLAIVASALAIGSLASPAIADQYIYWPGGEMLGAVNRVPVDNPGANSSFMTGLAGGQPAGIAVNGTNIFWSALPGMPNSPVVASANLDGTNQVNPVITLPGGPTQGAGPLAADSGHVYYGVFSGGGFNTQIKRADPDGGNQTNVGSAFSGQLSGLAVDSNNLYYNTGSTIVRVGLDGSNPTNLVTGLGGTASGLAVNSSYIYWGTSDSSSSTIGRANLDGTSPNASFISGLSKPAAVAIDNAHIFWTNSATGSIGRADIGGTNANTSFVTGAFTTGFVVKGLAVTSGGAAPATAPAAPAALVAIAGNGSASIAFTAGADNGAAITNYEYSVNNGTSWTTRSPASVNSPVSITGLTNRTSYQVKLRAVNSAGTGAASDAVSVTPVAPVVPVVPPAPPAKPAVVWSSSAKAKSVTALITPVAGVTYTLRAVSGSKTKTGSCKNVTIKQGKANVARRSCTLKLAKGTWLASVTPAKGAFKGAANTKSYKFK